MPIPKTHFSSMLLLLLLISFTCKASEPNLQLENAQTKDAISNGGDVDRIEPPNWWIDFETDALQLLVHHPDIGDYSPSISYEGVEIVKVTKAGQSPNYLFIDLIISKNTSSGTFPITFKNADGQVLIQDYELKSRQKPAGAYVGFNSSDAIYMLTPDRFANANPENDRIAGMNETKVDRANGYARHGGDIQGITQHLDYISNLGFTAIWPSPLLTNDMKSASYHGYAMTDFYQVDPRFGTLSEYRQLATQAQNKGIKLIMDQVANHCGLYHWWMRDLPFKDWVNLQENFEKHREHWDNAHTINASHRRTTNQDLYASQYDKDGNSEGWFVSTMPDLNQRNPFMATYLIQNSIWWIETLGLGGIRQDTYPYPDKQFMSDWAAAIMTEYPNFSIVGEEWSLNPLLIGYWQQGAENADGYQSHLRSTMDFAMQLNVVEALNETESWDKGLVKIYEGLANDFHYASPKDIMVFGDNHDMSRIFTQLDGDVANTKMAIATYAVLPRIFQMYYGTEILMDDFENPGDHGLIRTDFPGGWDGDAKNAFSGKNISAEEKDMQRFVSELLNFRKNSKAIHEGETMHFAPFDGVYFLFRIQGDETVVLILNKNEKPISIDLNRFSEMGLNGKTLRNIFSEDQVIWKKEMTIEKKGVQVLTTN
nr:glycoside hydrolase family 13 protein [Subsaximicrobium wynnwilliamsii]